VVILSAWLPSGCDGGGAAGPAGGPGPSGPTGSSGPSGPSGPIGFAFADVVTGLGATTDLGFLPDGRMVIVEKDGAVRLRAADGSVSAAGAFPVDTESEKGLLGVAVDPDFTASGRLFFYYSLATAAGGTDLDRHRVVSILLKADGTLDAATERVLISGLRGPANHDGGALAVGPDGHLYAGVGDTGCNSGQPPGPTATPTNYFPTCLTNGNGKILRVALDGSIPADNPLVGVADVTACTGSCGLAPAATAAPRTDLWAWGFRNPWRFAFDPQTGRLWVGDVGEITFEEVTVVQKGRHHGWPWREGAAGWPVSRCAETVGGGGDCVEPAYTCRHGAAQGGVDGDCQSISGGVFLPAPRWPAPLAGRYLFADNANRRLWTLDVNAARDGVVPGSRRDVAQLPGGQAPVALRVGPDGDVYVAVLPGRVLRISPGP
jgi:glucose/arabinose dehydrogenase